jgi:uncharacterized phosphatase
MFPFRIDPLSASVSFAAKLEGVAFIERYACGISRIYRGKRLLQFILPRREPCCFKYVTYHAFIDQKDVSVGGNGLTRVYLLRHGETEWNHDGNRYCGRTDLNLSATGKRQAEWVSEYLQGVPFTAAYASTLKRARATAEIIARHHDLPVRSDERIVEVDFGEWEGKTRPEFTKTDPESWEMWCLNPAVFRAGRTGETACEVLERGRSFFAELAQKHPDDTVLVVAHSSFNRIYLAGMLGMPLSNYRRLSQDNTGMNIFELSPDHELILIQMNINQHLVHE